jgi:hypothetical protein
MAWEHRLALHFMLAEMLEFAKFGVLCCTYIPNNSAHNGTITKALQGLTTISKELAEISDINDLFTDLIENFLGDARVG